MDENSKDYFIGISLAVLAGLIWSVLAIALKLALNFAPSATIVWFRFCVAALLLFIILLLFRPKELSLHKLPKITWIAGLALGVNYFGYMKGVELTSPSFTQIFIQLGPLLLALTGVFYFRESLSRRQLLGFAFALVGYFVFYRDQISHELLIGQDFNGGFWWLIIASVTWAVFAVIQKVIVRQHSTEKINLFIFLLCGLLMLPYANINDLKMLSFNNWLLMFFLALNTLISYGAIGLALKKIPASLVSLIITCNPLITLLIMSILEKMKVSWISPDIIGAEGYWGAGFVVMGVGLAVWKK